MYTELILGCSLSEKTPRILIEALDWVINSKKKPKYENPKNYEEKIYNERFIDQTFSEKEIEEFEKKYNLCYIIYSGSYYFGCADSKPSFYKDDISKDYKLSFRSNCKNGGIIENFLEYIKPYIASNGVRVHTGLKYYRITGKTENKDYYNLQWAKDSAEKL